MPDQSPNQVVNALIQEGIDALLKHDSNLSPGDKGVLNSLSGREEISVAEIKTVIGILRARLKKVDTDLYMDVMRIDLRKLKDRPEQVQVDTTPAQITVEISGRDGVRGLIWNGHEGKIAYDYGGDSPTVIMRFSGSIDAAVKINGKINGVSFTFQGEPPYTMSVDDVVYFLKQRYSLNGKDTQHVREIFEYYVNDAVRQGTIKVHESSPIAVVDGKIKVTHEDSGDLGLILKTLSDYQKYASHPDNYRAMLGWSLLAPLHFYMKSESVMGVKCPLILNTGETETGKTSVAQIFIGLGYSMKQDYYFYPFNRIKTLFMLSVHLSETNIPCLIDDIPKSWIEDRIEDLKSYSHSGIFGDRGKQTLTSKEYPGQRSFIMTINEDYALDTDLALATRLGVFTFGKTEHNRQNRERYAELFEVLPMGFMYDIFKALYADKDFSTLMKEAEKFTTTKQWFNFGIEAVNSLCKQYGVEPFELLNGHSERYTVSNSMEVAEAFISEWKRIMATEIRTEGGESVRARKYTSPLEGSLDVDELEGRLFIHFTSGALKKLNQVWNLNMRHRTAIDFIHNIDSRDDGVRVENEGKTHNIRLMGFPTTVFTISIPVPNTL